MKQPHKLLMVFVLALAGVMPTAQAERIKDLASIAGVRGNQLVGYGLVVGLLSKQGDTTQFDGTSQGLRNMLARLGLTMPPGVDTKTKNVALVAIHAELPPFAKPGQTIDVTVSSIGDAKSLRGGSLLMSPLKGADGQIYAVAQGSLVVNGLNESGKDGSKITVNNPSVGRIANGATVERAVTSPFTDGNAVTFNLHSGDFTTANRMVAAINKTLGEGAARAMDATSVRVSAPQDTSQRVAFAAMIENITLAPDDAPARIIVNSRTGTVVINSKVTVQPVAVTHGSLTVTINENPQVTQPAPFSQGQTVVTPQSNVTVDQEINRMFVFNPGVSLDEIVKAVNDVGASPSDLIAILEALKSAGALHAELIVI
ncbi:MAG: flagellar biosynthesis protein FlgI [Gammaproteobacteria bacterium HGW-Gammaproteobacteria-3]|nr:MAG: flagellar biosynthesis protein FlgI [Gammaproteobacteria bacterium HGW-Gammaproteobacteria-3]